MSEKSKLCILQNANGQFEVRLMDGNKATCASQHDAELVLAAVRRFYDGNTGRRLPRRTLAALERAGLDAANSVLYRSAMHNLSRE
jgi:hypothetical protein